MIERTLFSEYLKRCRAELGLSLRAFGERVGLSASYLHDLEHGRRDPPVDPETIAALAKAGVGSAEDLRAMADSARGVVDVSDLAREERAEVSRLASSFRAKRAA